MIEIQVLIPNYSNQGDKFTADRHKSFESHAANLFGGLSLYPNNVVGIWIDEETQYDDQNRCYGFAINNITEGNKVAEIVEFAKTHYEQLGIIDIL